MAPGFDAPARIVAITQFMTTVPPTSDLTQHQAHRRISRHLKPPLASPTSCYCLRYGRTGMTQHQHSSRDLFGPDNEVHIYVLGPRLFTASPSSFCTLRHSHATGHPARCVKISICTALDAYRVIVVLERVILDTTDFPATIPAISRSRPFPSVFVNITIRIDTAQESAL